MQQEDLLRATAHDLEVPAGEDASFTRSMLIDRINEWLQTDFPKLVRVLYRLDVSETRLRSLLRENPGQDAAAIITDLILERQLQKLRSRQQFSRRDENIDENEKW